jgi:hypothetical protein
MLLRNLCEISAGFNLGLELQAFGFSCHKYVTSGCSGHGNSFVVVIAVAPAEHITTDETESMPILMTGLFAAGIIQVKR